MAAAALITSKSPAPAVPVACALTESACSQLYTRTILYSIRIQYLAIGHLHDQSTHGWDSLKKPELRHM